MKLSTRLLLAFALTSLAGIALAALLVRQLVTSAFDDYVRDQRLAAYVEAASAYFAQQGSWEGAAGVLRNASEPESPSGPPFADGPPGRARNDFVLADVEGTIVVAPNPLLRGTPARQEDLARGTPITVNGQHVGTVFSLGPPPGRNPAEERYLARTDLALGAAALGALAVALPLSLLLARLITRPVRDLTTAARAIAEGKLRQEVPVRSRDELGMLAAQFNVMSARLDRANELRRRMTADIAHDLRTPLTVIAGYLEALRDESLRPTPKRFATMYDETQVLLRLVQDLHTLSLADAGELPLKLQPVAPRRLLERVATAYQHTASQAGIAIELDAEDGLPDLRLDIEQTVRALGNLMSNALRHTPTGGRVTLTARLTNDGVALEVADTGPGIPPEHLPNIFERFYRADSSRSHTAGGSGLGLAIVRSIVEAHGGQVRASSVPGHGATFTITLPASPAAPSTPAARAGARLA
ncbi:MAG: ATP-binding protein [Chloroflexi bacterium OHK40]